MAENQPLDEAENREPVDEAHDSWFDTMEHTEALERHLSSITVKDMLCYYIYKSRKDQIDSMLITSGGFWHRWRFNRNVWKKNGNKAKYKLYAEHIEKVESGIKDPGVFTNLPKGGEVDTSCVDWFSDQVAYFGRYSNEKESDVWNMKYLSIIQFRAGYERLLANERRHSIANNNATDDTIMTISQHLKMKTEWAARQRILASMKAVDAFRGEMN